MYKNINLKTIVVAIFILFITACSKDDEILLSNEQNVEMQLASAAPEFRIKISGRLHRGSMDCVAGFGICDVSIEIEFGWSQVAILEPYIDVNGYSSVDIDILEPHAYQNLSKFFGEEEDPFEIPTDISNELGYSFIEIQPDDYLFEEFDPPIYLDDIEEYSYGRITVNVDAVK